MLWWTLQNVMLAAVLAGIVSLVCSTRWVGPAARHLLWLVVLVKLITPPLVVWPWAIPNPLPTIGTQALATAPDVATSAAIATSSVELRANDVLPPLSDTPPSALTYAEAEFPPEDWPPLTADPPILAEDVVAAPSGPPSPTRAAAHPLGSQWIAAACRAAGAIWLAGAVAFAALQTIRIGRMLRHLRRAGPADETVNREAARLAARLGLRPIPVRKVSGIGTPLIWAFPRPCLLWPAEMSADLPLGSLQGLLVHELAHVKRRDHLVGWLELIAGCVWWWNPLYWYVRHQLRENAELACDAWVVGTLPKGRRAYAEGLLAVCECISLASVPLPALSARPAGRRSFERRLTMILRDRISARLSWGGVLAAVLLAVTALPAWSQKPADPPAVGEPSGEADAALVIEAVDETQAIQTRRVLGLPARAESGETTIEVYARPPVPTLPSEASEAVERYTRLEAEARQETERWIAERRAELIGRLEKLRDRLANEDRFVDAAAIQAWIGKSGAKTESTVRGLHAYGDRQSASRVVEVTGSREGVVWGTDTYTDDSNLAAAAVHAGVLEVGQKGLVRLTSRPGQSSYSGTSRHGVTSFDYGPWTRSFQITAAGADVVRAAADPGTLVEFRGHPRGVLTFAVVGSNDGYVWGTDVYTDDSPLATAAVHAGLLEVGQRGLVRVEVLPGRDRYEGSSRHGISSHPYLAWEGSYRFVSGGPATEIRATKKRTVLPDPGMLFGLRSKVGQTFAFDVVAAREPDAMIWGTGIYTDDSALAIAVVHAGLLKNGERGTVTVTILPGAEGYEGTTKNGVKSYDYGPYPGSYRIDGVQASGPRVWKRIMSHEPDQSIVPDGHKVGDSYEQEVVGSVEGAVWGTDVYTADSSLEVAAVHAGVLEPGEKGMVRITILEGRDSYAASNRLGVQSQTWGAYPRCFKLERGTKKLDFTEETAPVFRYRLSR